MQVRYARTSTEEQVAELEAQIRDLKAAGLRGGLFRAGISPGDRQELDRMLKFLRTGDTLMVTKIDRLARNTRTLGDIVDGLHGRGVGLKVLQFGKEVLDTTGAYGRLMLNMFAALAEFERGLIKERQKASRRRGQTRNTKGGSPRREQRPVKQSLGISNRSPCQKSPHPWASLRFRISYYPKIGFRFTLTCMDLAAM
ncbi:recombinase family protein [Mesorhizobium sp. M0174]|uniref:recombinase family protein n=1 Tax=Mesorhizobium sp. M0174 TaxID=2956904 RepID=UPI00333BA425